MDNCPVSPYRLGWFTIRKVYAWLEQDLAEEGKMNLLFSLI
jgi:hypothetical protein